MADSNCSFCGKRSSEVFRIISADGCKICNECIARCAEMISQEYRNISHEMRLPPPIPGGEG